MAPVPHMHISPKSLGIAGGKAGEQFRRDGKLVAPPQESGTLRTLDSISAWSSRPFMLQMGAMLLIPAGWVAGSLFKSMKWRSRIQAPMTALNGIMEMPVARTLYAPAHVAGAYGASAEEHARGLIQEARGLLKEAREKNTPPPTEKIGALKQKIKALKGIAKDARLTQGEWEKSGAAYAGKASQVVQPVAKQASRLADAVAVSAPGRWISGSLQSLADKRIARIDARTAQLAGKVVAQHEMEAVGMFARAGQFLGLRSANQVGRLAMAADLHGAAHAVHMGGSTTGLMDAYAHLVKHAPKLDGEEATRFGRMMGNVAKIEKMAGKIPFWESVKAGGFATALKGMPKAAGSMSVMTALIATGLAATAAAMTIRTKDGNKETRALYHSFAADMYGVPEKQLSSAMLHSKDAPALLKNARGRINGQTRGNWVSAASHVAGEAVYLMPGVHMGMGGLLAVAPIMAVQGGVGLVGDLAKVENPVLQAYGVLRAVEQGKAELKPEQRANVIKILVGASDVMAKNGGVYNKLSGPIAADLAGETMPVKQLLKEISTPGALEARAVKLQEKAKAAQTTVKASEVGQTAENVAKVMPAANSNVPDTKVSGPALEGRIQQASLSASR